MRLVILALSCLVFSGCLNTPVQRYESYKPEIPALESYPGGKSKQKFWDEKAAFYRELQGKTQFTPADMQTLIKCLFDVDTVLEAREKQIEAYNKWAKIENEKNGYTKP